MKQLVTGLQNDTRHLSNQLQVAQWQNTAFDVLSKDVHPDSIVLHMDFSENYSTFYEQEISSAHWMKLVGFSFGYEYFRVTKSTSTHARSHKRTHASKHKFPFCLFHPLFLNDIYELIAGDKYQRTKYIAGIVMLGDPVIDTHSFDQGLSFTLQR